MIGRLFVKLVQTSFKSKIRTTKILTFNEIQSLRNQNAISQSMSENYTYKIFLLGNYLISLRGTRHLRKAEPLYSLRRGPRQIDAVKELFGHK